MLRRISAEMGRSIVLFLFVVCAAGPAIGDDDTSSLSADEKKVGQEKIEKMANETLATLYETQPKAKDVIAQSQGYAVFRNFGLNILFAGGGSGKGVAVNQVTGDKTYMKMLEVQAGLGVGIKKFQLVWVFEDQADFKNFISQGWEFGGQATAAAKLDDDGGAMQGAISVKQGVWVYQLTADGLAVELTLKGTKYYRDDKLN